MRGMSKAIEIDCFQYRARAFGLVRSCDHPLSQLFAILRIVCKRQATSLCSFENTSGESTTQDH